MTVSYHASASFDVTSEVCVPDNADSREIWLAIIEDLESRYGLTVEYPKA